MSDMNSIPKTQSHGLVGSAQDSNSPTSAKNVEKKIVEESLRAGVAAFSFDPDASPEEKAAQASALIPEGFHRQHQVVTTAIATDLESPSLPSINLPLSSGASEYNDPANGANIKQLVDEKSPSNEQDEEQRWIERAGWAPRFGNPALPINEENLADHQTWIEEKLNDKYFGDWYHNTAVIIFACLASWLVAILGGGVACLILIMTICGTYYRTSIRRVRRNFRDDISREVAMRKLETDTESLEWINSFLVKFWPIFQPVFAETMINSVDQILSSSTPTIFDSLRLKTFTLGSKPPRMEHVKTYPNAEDDIILMDWKFSLNPMDRTDMTSRQIKNQINPKVVLEIRVGKAIISKGLDVIVEDMAFSGLMRIKFKLQIPFPHVEKIEVSFLEKPLIDYVCKPLGGETLGFDINFIPGLESFIQDQIHANIGPMLYAPNFFAIEVAQLLSGTPMDQAAGVLAVTVHGAQGLKNPDKFSGLPDPYVKFSLNSGATLAQTKVVKENPNPKWNETKFLIYTSFMDSLTLQIYDYNEIRKDRELGTATFPLESVQDNHNFENEQLEIIYNGKTCGTLSADIRLFPVLQGRELPDGSKEPPPESNTGIARFTVEQAKDLDGTKSLIGQLNPYAILTLNNKEIHISRKLKRTNNPIWDNGSKEILITDRKNAKMGLIIKDDRDLSTDPILGTYQIKLDDMLVLMEKGHEWYNLNGAKTGRVKLKLQWKPVALSGIGSGSGGYITPIGVMRFHFKDARKLRNAETLGKSDPYVRVLLSGIEKGRTVTFESNLNPDWDEVIYVPVHSTREQLTLEVMDEEKLSSDRSLGFVELSTVDFISKTEDGEYMVREPVAQVGQLHTHKKEPSRGTLNYTVGFYPCLNITDPDNANDEVPKYPRSDSRISTTSEKSENSKHVAKVTDDQIKIENINDLSITDPANKKEEKTLQPSPKIRLTAEELLRYESGLVIFKIMDVDVFKTNVYIEFLVDDMVFPSYSSSLIRKRKTTLDEIGDCIIREMEYSRITLRICEKGKIQNGDKKNKDQTIARYTSSSFEMIKQCLNNPTTLLARNEDDEVCTVKVSMKYLPLNMKLDPNESIRNMGKLRVDVLDASDLPSADRNGYSDAFCKFELNGKEIYKTKVIKKSLNPVWNEFFEVDIPSRTAAQLNCKVYDWDFGEKNDWLGSATIDLSSLDMPMAQEKRLKLDGKSGSVRFRLLFIPDYITRYRQRSTNITGTFKGPCKIVTGVAGVPLKGVGFAAQGVSKGASFLRTGLKSKKRDDDSTYFSELADPEITNEGDLAVVSGSRHTSVQISSTPPSITPAPHSRTKSLTASSDYSMSPNARPPSSGTALFTIVSASGYPRSTNLIVHLKQLSPRPKTLHKTEHIKSATGNVTFDERKESFKCHCAADTQFQIQVKDHRTFGSDDDLGGGIFFLDDSGGEVEKKVKVGNGFVTIKSSFVS